MRVSVYKYIDPATHPENQLACGEKLSPLPSTTLDSLQPTTTPYHQPIISYHKFVNQACRYRNELGKYEDQSLADCEQRCTEEDTCISFEFYRDPYEGRCQLSTTCTEAHMTPNTYADLYVKKTQTSTLTPYLQPTTPYHQPIISYHQPTTSSLVADTQSELFYLYYIDNNQRYYLKGLSKNNEYRQNVGTVTNINYADKFKIGKNNVGNYYMEIDNKYFEKKIS